MRHMSTCTCELCAINPDRSNQNERQLRLSCEGAWNQSAKWLRKLFKQHTPAVRSVSQPQQYTWCKDTHTRTHAPCPARVNPRIARRPALTAGRPFRVCRTGHMVCVVVLERVLRRMVWRYYADRFFLLCCSLPKGDAFPGATDNPTLIT